MPKFYPTLGEKDWFTIEKWYVAEGDLIQPGNLLACIECAIGFFTIPTPAKKLCRVERILVPAGSPAHLGELIVVLAISQQLENDYV